MSSILSRIQEIVIKEGTTITAMERNIGASKGVLSRAIANGTDIQSKWLQGVVENYPSYSAEWLITGRMPMLKDEHERDHSTELLPSINQNYEGAPYYNTDFIGGFDFVSNDQTHLPDFYINYPPYNKQGVMWCNLTGHSMEPEISNGDIIAVKEVNSPIEYLPAGEIYGIVTDDFRTVKRIRISKEHRDFVRLIPSNKSPEYCEQEIPIEMIRRVYAVLGSIRKFF
ncbi:phage repressor protein C with HTH and peptisase S24 domain [Bacteroides heparinolyticus]|uniref:Phage repressor protein C with HTH and peptisase S24 domain n=1 Tax=Prevotella heparinolytica TaxID=28113 RepID=A0A4R2LGV2_9BACE|nr:phage repressor protein C with HTH and peptisase S24 domain [Bacteroides heparinolyticus]